MADSINQILLQTLIDLIQNDSQFNVMMSISYSWAISSQKCHINMGPIVRGYGAVDFFRNAIM